MNDSILLALKEINEAYEKTKDILKQLIEPNITELKKLIIIKQNQKFLQEIGVLE